MRLYNIIYLIALSLMLSFCKNDPVTPDNNTTTGTTTGGTTGGTTTGNTTTNEICFTSQILPIFLSNCTQSGCHDSKSKKDGYDLTSYAKIMENKEGIVAGNPENSEIYEEIAKNSMPPSPYEPLSQEHKKLIYDWIKEGAKNTTCDNTDICNVTEFSFSKHIFPIIQSNCKGCHSGANPSGKTSITNYEEVKAIADKGSLVGTIKALEGFSQMPPSQKLSDCDINAIAKWVETGSANN